MKTPSRRVRFVAGAALVSLSLLGSAACGSSTVTTNASSDNNEASSSADKPKPSNPQLVSYDLPPGMVPITPTKDGNPTQVHGVLGIPGPTWKGKRPVAVLVHGTHDTCEKPAELPELAVSAAWPVICQTKRYLRSDVGMSWLVEELARQGFVAVSIDVATAEQWWNGEADATKGYRTLVEKHLDLLSDFSQGKDHGLDLPDLKGRIDTGKVALVGHSRGGGFVANKSAAEIPGLFATVSLEPQEDAPEMWADQTVPVLNLRGQCDEEVTPEAGAKNVAWLAKQGSSPHVLDVLVKGTTHWSLNTGWAGFFPNPCKPADTAKAEDSRAQVGPVVGAFLTQALDKAKAYTLPNTGLIDSAKDAATGEAVKLEKTQAGGAYTDPKTIKEQKSTEALLPAIPADFKYDESTSEDY